MKISIDTGDLIRLQSDGKTFFWNPDAEQSLADLLSAQEAIENAINTVKLELAEAGTKENPEFTGVRGSKIQASYAPHGTKYELTVDGSKVEAAYVKAKVTYAIDSKAVDDYIKSHATTPEGIRAKSRKKSVTLKMV